MTDKTKILRHYSAPCHVCGGTGLVENIFFEICETEEADRLPCRQCEYYDLCSRGEMKECSACNGNGTVHLYCVEEPTLELRTIPDVSEMCVR